MGRIAAVLTLPVLVWASAAFGKTGEARVVVIPGQVRAFVGGEMTARPVDDPPPASDLRSMRVAKGKDGGYVATLTFAAGTWERIARFGDAAATHQVFVSLQPPGGAARMRVHLNSDGVATLDRAQGDRFVKVGDAVARPAGASVVFEVAPSVGMTAEWEVQGHSLVRNARGAGVHAHTAQVLVGSLTGEQGRVLRLPAEGTRLDRDAVPLLWEPRAAMPVGTRPTSVRIARREGDLSVDVGMDAPPAVATVDGKRATAQFIALVLGEPGSGDEYTVLFDVVNDRTLGLKGDASGVLARDVVAVRGNVVSFSLDEAAGTAAGVLRGAVLAGSLAQADPAGEPPGAPPDAPPLPAIGADTDIAVGSVVGTQEGGVAIESPVVPAGDLLPEEPPVGGGGGFPTTLIVALVVILLGAVLAWFLSRGSSSPPDEGDEGDPQDEKPDCSELLAEFERRRAEVTTAEARRDGKLRDLERVKAEIAAEEAIISGAVTEFGFDFVGGASDRYESKTTQWGDRRANAEAGVDAAAQDLAKAEGKLAEAARNLKDCLERAGPEPDPSVLSQIDEVIVIS